MPLNFDQQRLEADFRFSLVRLREDAESVALYRGEAMELISSDSNSGSVFGNFWQIMKRQKRLAWFTSGYGQVALIFPVVVVAPRYFAKQIGLGVLMQVVGAFTSVQSRLSFIITSYTNIAAWQAVTERLSGFEERLTAIHHSTREQGPIAIRRAETGVNVDGIDLDLPDGQPLFVALPFRRTRRIGADFRSQRRREKYAYYGQLPDSGHMAEAKSVWRKDAFFLCPSVPICRWARWPLGSVTLEERTIAFPRRCSQPRGPKWVSAR